MENRKLITPKDITTALKEIGVKKGQTIMVHTSLSSLGYVCGGAQSVIEALMGSVSEEGTIMMPTQSWKNLDPSTVVYWQEPEKWWPVIREYIPAYDTNKYNGCRIRNVPAVAGDTQKRSSCKVSCGMGTPCTVSDGTS